MRRGSAPKQAVFYQEEGIGMKKQKRRLIALALSAAMAVNLMVYPAAAEGSGRTGDGENTGSSQEGLNRGTYHEVDPATPGNGSYNLLPLEREVAPATPGNADPFGKYGETVNMKIGRVGGGQLSTENNVGKWYQDHLNVTYDFQSVSSDEEWLSKSLNELPDVMQISDRKVLDQLVEKGYVADLTEVYDTYASDDVRAIYESYAKAGAGLRPATFSGQLMALPGAIYGTQNLSLVWVRQDWLDQLKDQGEEVAVDTDGDKVITPAELKAVAKAFVENKLGGEDTVGIANYDSIGDQNRAIFSAFHAYPEKWLMAEDGTIYNGSTAPEMKEALAYLRELNEEGLLDPEFATRDWNGLDALAKNHKLGIFINTWDSGSYELTSLLNWVENHKEKPKLSCFLLGDVNGQINVPIANTLTGFIAVRSDYAHPEAAMKLVNLIVDVDRGARESDPDFYRSKYNGNVLRSYEGYRTCIENGSAGNLEPFTLDWYANDDLEKKIYEPVRKYTDEVEREENLDPDGPDGMDSIWPDHPSDIPNVYFNLWEHATNEDGHDREQYAERFLMPAKNTDVLSAYNSYATWYDKEKYGDFYKWYAGVDCLLKNSGAINWVNCIYTEDEGVNINWDLWGLTKEVYVNIIKGTIPEEYEGNVDKYFDWFVQEWNNQGGAADSARICGFEGSGLHKWGAEGVIKEPTCTETGMTGQTCEVCGKVKPGQVMEMIPHTYVDGVCTVCGSPEPSIPPQEPFERYDETVELTIGRVGGGEASTENNVGKWYQDHLNVTYRFQSAGSDEEWLTKSLEELPDVLQISSREILRQLVEKGYVADLTEVYGAYASDDVKAVFDSYQDAGAGLKPATFDGRLMALPGTMYGTQQASLVWIRRDWLDIVGLSGKIDTDGNGVITRGELETVARAFVDQKPGGADTIGIANYASIDDANRGIFSSFESYPGKWLRDGDGNVYSGSTAPETREALAYLQRLYEEGLLDPEFGNRDWFDLNGIDGLTTLAKKNQLGILINTWTSGPEVLNGELSCYILGDDEGRVSIPISNTLDGFIVVRKGYEHPEAVMKLVNQIADVDRGARNTDEDFYKLKDNGSGYRELLAAGSAHSLEPFSLSWYANDDLEKAMYGQVADYVEATGGNVYNGNFWEGGDQEEGKNREEYADRFLMPPSAGDIIWNYNQYIREGIEGENGDGRYRLGYYKWFAGTDCLLKSLNAGSRSWTDCIYVAPTSSMEGTEQSLSNLTRDTFVKIIRGELPVDYFDTYVYFWNRRGGTEYLEKICGSEEGSGLHEWKADSVIEEATCTETGVRRYVCERCGAVKTGTISRLPHQYVSGKCAVCGSFSSQIPSEILDNVTWIKLGDGSWKLVKEDGSYAERIWANVNGVWYYFHENGIMATGWLYLDDVWYHLNNETGAMETGWYLDTDGKWYYLDSSGAMKTGWVKLGEIWYYLVPERIGNHLWGSMYANEYTPDGYWVNANGEWFDPFKSDGSAVTVTIGRSTGDGDWLLAEHGWTYENNPVIDWYEQQLNVDIRFAEGGTDYDSVIRKAMASGNLPDVMQVYSRELLNELVAKGLVEDLTDVYNNYASAAIKDVYGSYEGAGAGLKPGTFGGRIMALPGTMYGTQLTSLVWIRQDWLDQVGITLDEDGNGVISRSELEMTARAFLEKDPGGTGNPVGIANYVYTGDENRAIFSSFHSYPEKLLRAADGTVYNGSTAPETKEALSYLHRLYAEGLLDPQYGTRDWDGLVSLADNNQLGIFFNTWTSGPEVLKDGNLSCFVLGDDNGQVNVPISDTFHDGFVVVRKGYEHPEVVMRLVNLMADVEYGARNSDRGFYKTEYRNLKDAGTAYIVEPFTLAWHGNDDLDMKMYKPSRDYIDQTNGNIYGDLWEHPTNSEGRNREQYADRFAVPASTGGILWNYYDYIQQNNGNSRGEYYKWFAGVDSMLKSKSSGVWKWVDCLYPVMPEAMTNLYWDIYGYTEDVFVKIVKGELPIDYFDTYAAEWKKRGGAEYCRKAAEMSAR